MSPTLISLGGAIGRSPATVAVAEARARPGISAAAIAGGRGTTTKRADISQALAAN